jgi:uncharacterized protein YjiS (DUF1127 family)
MTTVWSALRKIVANATAWPERQRVLNELYAMDDRSLADIGIHRSEIPFVFQQLMTHDNDNALTHRAA